MTTTPLAEFPSALSPTLAWQSAYDYRTRFGVNRVRNDYSLEARTEYALRRIGGLKYLESRLEEFQQAYNEAPFPDSDLDTVLQPDEMMKLMSDGGVQRVKR